MIWVVQFASCFLFSLAPLNTDVCNLFNPGPTRKPNGNDQPRVVFIVSTVNLVLQQKERFEAFLGDKYSVADISGSNCAEIPLKFLLQNNDVVVMTAMILVNALKATEKGNRVELRDISLLLFDECHHAHKEHPYNSIMEMYLALKSQAGHQQRLPQVRCDKHWLPIK